MKYPLSFLKEQLNEIEMALKLCLKNDNTEDYNFIVKQAISLLELAETNKLFK